MSPGTLGRRGLLGAALAAPALGRAAAQDGPGLRELARRAAIYFFPTYEMYRTRWRATVDDRNPFRQRLNRFVHAQRLADWRARDVTTPNHDTLYSSAWLDLSLEPLFLTVPPVGDLYYSYAFLDLHTNNFAYVSHRLYGGDPPTHMIVGPAWNGDASFEVKLVRAPTNSVWLIGRLLVENEAELEPVRILQRRVLLETPDMRNERRILETGELMRHRVIAPPEPVADWPAPNPGDPFDLFEVCAHVLREGPLTERDKSVLPGFAPLRLRPGKFDLRAFGDAERRAIQSGIEQAMADIRGAGARRGRTIDGWSYPPPQLGNFGDDYLYRAAVALGGLGALEPAEAIYASCGVDRDGAPLSGVNDYRITFAANGMPPAHAFWSLSMYEVTPEGRAFFVDNPIGRYAIGDRTDGLQRNADGSLTLHLQRSRPDGEAAANWLPTPAGAMRLVLRAYEPGEALINGSYRLPGVQRAGR
ncbi:MAG: DUF1254 domain-containing protein [Reyranellaceae bacterium]